jgi:cytochrome c oxidase assembly protein subunit 15
MSENTNEEAILSPPAIERLALGFGALVMLTFGLIVLGALVRANGAGLACPDWPLCFGDLVPRMDLKVAFEWTHRVVAGAVALIFLTLGHLAWRAARHDAALFRLLSVAAALLLVQILLGALTVWLKLAPWTVTAHLVLGNGFAATALIIALTLRDRVDARSTAAAASDAGRRWITCVGLLLLLQMILGGLVSSRYAGLACTEWPTCNAGLWFPSWNGNVGLQLLHRLNAYALVGCLGITAWVVRREPRLRTVGASAFALGVGQLGVGVANVLTGIPADLTGLHSALAAGLVLSVAFALRAAWSARPAPS